MRYRPPGQFLLEHLEQRLTQPGPGCLPLRLERHGRLLTRMHHEVGMAWPEAFGTGDRAEVDAYCAAAGIDHEWLPGDRLRTRQRRAAVVRHPTTGVPGWFNQIASLNGLTMDPAVREYLTDVYGPHGLPFHTMVGDGTDIDGDTVEAVNAVYDRFTVPRRAPSPTTSRCSSRDSPKRICP
ncbi:hypothetical protein SVIO_026210 [Streptomyces violaceusniger]|uniref:TauD/TfdA-like domain-containing protein n=2 Tax=Streptomyces violaceusniger TaxID=68280 RepID=A0A4D4L067_STRVO|nr:hypothetical protein SVIO_026210 [Streptomyces violaceusniger]